MRIKRVVSTCPVNPKLKHIHSSNVIQTDTDFIKMPLITACVQGSRGSGKTVAVVTWVKHMERNGYVTRTFLISPTAETNKVFKNLSTLNDDNICSTPNMFQQALQTVYSRVKQSMKEHKDSLKYKQVFEKYKNNEILSLAEESMLQQQQYNTPHIVACVAVLLHYAFPFSWSISCSTPQHFLSHGASPFVTRHASSTRMCILEPPLSIVSALFLMFSPTSLPLKC